MSTKPDVNKHMSQYTYRILIDLGVHEDSVQLVWTSIVEDLSNHFTINPRKRRRSKKTSRIITPSSYLDTDEWYEDWLKSRTTGKNKEDDKNKKKDHIPVSALIKDEAKSIKQEQNKERRQRILDEIQDQSKDEEEKTSEDKSAPPRRKRQGTW